MKIEFVLNSDLSSCSATALREIEKILKTIANNYSLTTGCDFKRTSSQVSIASEVGTVTVQSRKCAKCPTGICEEAEVGWDPHFARSDGTSFDVHQTGHHKLLRIPVRGVPNLDVSCQIQRYGEYCANTFITQVEIKGLWIEGNSELQFFADTPFTGNSTKSLAIGRDWVAFKAHGIGIELFRERIRELPYLNLRISGMGGRLAGGLLGHDSYAEAAAGDPTCRRGRPRADALYGASFVRIT